MRAVSDEPIKNLRQGYVGYRAKGCEARWPRTSLVTSAVVLVIVLRGDVLGRGLRSDVLRRVLSCVMLVAVLRSDVLRRVLRRIVLYGLVMHRMDLVMRMMRMLDNFFACACNSAAKHHRDSGQSEGQTGLHCWAPGI